MSITPWTPPEVPSTDVNDYNATPDKFILDGLDLTPHNESTHATALKCSHQNGVSGVELRIPAGNQASVDVDLCQNVTLDGEWAFGPVQPQTPIRCKGGSAHIKFSGKVHQRGTRKVFPWCKTPIDIELGDWMDQRWRLCHTIDVSGLSYVDGSPLNVCIGWCDPFTIKVGDNTILWGQSVGMAAYVLFKGIVRWILRIPTGTKGPSWLP